MQGAGRGYLPAPPWTLFGPHSSPCNSISIIIVPLLPPTSASAPSSGAGLGRAPLLRATCSAACSQCTRVIGAAGSRGRTAAVQTPAAAAPRGRNGRAAAAVAAAGRALAAWLSV